MPKLRVHNFSVSLDGYAAGPDQSLDTPLVLAGRNSTTGCSRPAPSARDVRRGGRRRGRDDRFAAAGEVGLGATIMGRNMFGPIRGDWTDDEWKGWWGDDPPYHHPTFVLTHHPHESITMEGGTVFHFVTDGIEAALEQAYEAADRAGRELAGGASTIQQYLRAGLVDEMHLAYAPLLLGSGERTWGDLDRRPKGMRSPSSSELRPHCTSDLCGRAESPCHHVASGMGASRNDVIIGSSRSARFTNVT